MAIRPYYLEELTKNGIEKRIVVKRTWLRLWFKKRRVRQSFQITDYGTELTGCIWNWCDEEVLPDLAKARTLK